MKMRIKYLRENAKMTQKDLAQKIGTSVSNVSKYELGQIEPNIEMLTTIASTFGVSVDYLLGLSNNPNADQTAQTTEESDFDYVYIMGANGNRQKYFIPPEMRTRFKKLMEGGLPEIFD